MNTNQIKTFLCVVESKGISAAANKLYITQSSVSYQISTLEKELGIELIDHKSRNFKLSEAGIFFYNRIKKISDELECTIYELSDYEENREKVLTFHFPGVQFTDAITPYLKKYMVDNPKTLIRFDKGTFNEGCEVLDSKQIDFTYVFDYQVKNEPHVKFIPITNCSLMCVVSKNHPLAEKESVVMEDLKNQTLLLYDIQHTRVPISFEMEKVINQNNINVKLVKDMEIQMLEASCGNGIAIQPFFYHFGNYNLKAIPIRGLKTFTRGLAYSRSNTNVELRKFINCVQKV